MYLLKRVRIRFGWRSCVRVDCSILHGVDAVVITQSFCLLEDSAEHRLNSLQTVTRQFFLPNLVEPSLHRESAKVFQIGALLLPTALKCCSQISLYPLSVLGFLVSFTQGK